MVSQTSTRPAPLQVLIYVQHLLGSGHLARMRRVAAALAARQHRVCLLSGGPASGDAPGYTTIQLPSLKTAPGDFTRLLTAAGQPPRAAWLAARRQQVLEALAQYRPQVLVVESYPFGRKQLRHEIQPMVELAHQQRPRAQVVCSIRDVLQRRSAAREQETRHCVARYFDAVLVHGDANWIPLAASYAAAAQLADKIHYTGYVVAPPATRGAAAQAVEIVVSAGGGAVGAQLIEAALGAWRVQQHRYDWRILVGGGVDAQQLRQYQHAAARPTAARGRLVVERNRADFASLLARCALSVSQAGYNTCMDVLQARCRSVWVPYARDGETEQRQRAEWLTQRGAGVMLTEDQLDAASLNRAIQQAFAQPHPSIALPACDGARVSCEIIEKLVVSGR